MCPQREICGHERVTAAWVGAEFVELTGGTANAETGIPRSHFLTLAGVSMKKLSALTLTMFVFGCGVYTNASLVDPSIHLARLCPDGVKLYTAPDRVTTDYREVALLNASGETRYSDEGDLIKSMRKAAAKIGANGIILNGIDEPSAATKVAAEVSNIIVRDALPISPERKGRALAIFVPADSANAAAVCARTK